MKYYHIKESFDIAPELYEDFKIQMQKDSKEHNSKEHNNKDKENKDNINFKNLNKKDYLDKQNPSVKLNFDEIINQKMEYEVKKEKENKENQEIERKNISKKSKKLNINELVEKTPRNIYRLKTILLGSIAVGKTSLLNRFVSNKFSNDYICSLGVEYKVKSIIIDNSTIVDLQIWDTCGQEKFRTITRQYYQNSSAVILMFDLTNKNSFDEVVNWIADVQNFGPEDCICAIVGNKMDLKEDRKITFEEGVKLAKSFNYDYFEISAKSDLVC